MNWFLSVRLYPISVYSRKLFIKFAQRESRETNFSEISPASCGFSGQK